MVPYKIFLNIFFSGVCERLSVHPDKPTDQQSSDLGKGEHDVGDTVKDQGGRRHEDTRTSMTASSHSASADSDKSQVKEPEHSPSASRDAPQRRSASTRRALFARRSLDTSASASSGGSHSPTTPSLVPSGRRPSPPRSPSPRPRHSPPPPSSCHASASALRPGSPVRGLSPRIVRPHGPKVSGSPGCLPDTSTQCHATQCLHPIERPSTARLVSVRSFQR